jgi:hypothetical protein
MLKQLKLKTLMWAHKFVAGWNRALEARLRSQLDPFTEQDMEDELLNRYPA